MSNADEIGWAIETPGAVSTDALAWLFIKETGQRTRAVHRAQPRGRRSIAASSYTTGRSSGSPAACDPPDVGLGAATVGILYDAMGAAQSALFAGPSQQEPLV